MKAMKELIQRGKPWQMMVRLFGVYEVRNRWFTMLGIHGHCKPLFEEDHVPSAMVLLVFLCKSTVGHSRRSLSDMALQFHLRFAERKTLG